MPRRVVSGAVAALGLLTAAAVGAGSAPADAAFPGWNGLLVFERELPAGDHTQTDLYTVGPDGSQLTRLTDTPNRNEFGAAWNAKGTEIAFWRTRAPFGPGSIWVMNADGDQPRRLTRGIDARDPAWNPAGSRLVFTQVHNGGFDLWTMRASDGGAARRLTSGSALDFEPAWSPDGIRIAFTQASAQGGPGDIYLLDLKSGRLRQITHSPAYDHQVAWAPRRPPVGL